MADETEGGGADTNEVAAQPKSKFKLIVMIVGALAAGGLHGDEGRPANRDVERIVGALERALREIVESAAVLDIGEAAVAAREIVFMCRRVEVLLEQHLVGLVAVGVDVREVVRDHGKMPLERRDPRKSDEKRILHRWFSP